MDHESKRDSMNFYYVVMRGGPDASFASTITSTYEEDRSDFTPCLLKSFLKAGGERTSFAPAVRPLKAVSYTPFGQWKRLQV